MNERRGIPVDMDVITGLWLFFSLSTLCIYYRLDFYFFQFLTRAGTIVKLEKIKNWHNKSFAALEKQLLEMLEKFYRYEDCGMVL